MLGRLKTEAPEEYTTTTNCRSSHLASAKGAREVGMVSRPGLWEPLLLDSLRKGLCPESRPTLCLVNTELVLGEPTHVVFLMVFVPLMSNLLLNRLCPAWNPISCSLTASLVVMLQAAERVFYGICVRGAPWWFLRQCGTELLRKGCAVWPWTLDNLTLLIQKTKGCCGLGGCGSTL